MRKATRQPAMLLFVTVALAATITAAAGSASAQRGPAVRAWIGEVTIPTYRLGPEDINPHFQALGGSIIYPYTMQDRFTTERVDVTYRAVFLENEYLRVMCLPEIGGRIQSVFDKVTGEEMFYRNNVIRPGHIALRGAWVSGGVEWNRGPQGHTVTSFSPVDVVPTANRDGSASLLIGNTEMNYRTGWQVRLTLYPNGRYLDEQIKLFNPTDGFHPYYFWNNTAFPNRPGTRFVYPMTLGMDHAGTTFFSWPVHEGRDLRWLRNYPEPTSVFGYQVEFDFFGAYDVDRDYGIVQSADHHVLPGKKAWTWGEADSGLAAQAVLTDDDGPYIEVQSGPLPTQNDLGVLAPGQELSWREYWYPVSGLGDGFEFANRDVVVQRIDSDTAIEFRLAATSPFPGARVEIEGIDGRRHQQQLDLSPARTDTIRIQAPSGFDREQLRYRVAVYAENDVELLAYESPLAIPDRSPPTATAAPAEPDAQTEYRRASERDRYGDLAAARGGYERALAIEPAHVASLRALASLELESGRYEAARSRAREALVAEPDDGWSWYLLAVARLQLGDPAGAIDAGFEATKRAGTVAPGHSVIGRARARLGDYDGALEAFDAGLAAGGGDWTRLFENLLLATYGAGHRSIAYDMGARATDGGTLRLVPHVIQALGDSAALETFVTQTREWLGEPEFAYLELANTFIDLGLLRDAANLIEAALVRGISIAEQRPLGLYYLAYLNDRLGNEDESRRRLAQAAGLRSNRVFPSRPETLAVLRYAIERDPNDGRAHLYLGNLMAGLGRIDEAAHHWSEAARTDANGAVARRNLALVAWHSGDLEAAADRLARAHQLRPAEQTYVRDLAKIRLEQSLPEAALDLLRGVPPEGRRADVTLLLARTQIQTGRYDEAIGLLESTTFTNREGDTGTWQTFASAHIERGISRLESGSVSGALEDFDAALTYPPNLNAGRPHRPLEARAQYWRGRALEAQGQVDQALEAFRACAAGTQTSDEQREHVALCRERLQQPG